MLWRSMSWRNRCPGEWNWGRKVDRCDKVSVAAPRPRRSPLSMSSRSSRWASKTHTPPREDELLLMNVTGLPNELAVSSNGLTQVYDGTSLLAGTGRGGGILST